MAFKNSDEMFAGGPLMGAGGGICSFYNVISDLFLKIYLCARARQWDKARCVQQWINELIRMVLHFPALSAVKTLLKWSRFNCELRLALREKLTEAPKLRLHEAFDASNLHGCFPGVR